MKIEFRWRLFLEILIIHKPALGTCEVPHKIWANQFWRFDVYWIPTNKHPDMKSIYIQDESSFY